MFEIGLGKVPKVKEALNEREKQRRANEALVALEKLIYIHSLLPPSLVPSSLVEEVQGNTWR